MAINMPTKVNPYGTFPQLYQTNQLYNYIMVKLYEMNAFLTLY